MNEPRGTTTVTTDRTTVRSRAVLVRVPILALLVALVVALVVGACGDDGDDADAAESTTTAATTEVAAATTQAPPVTAPPSTLPVIIDPADTDKVAEWQAILVERGADIVVDGIWGPNTEQATKDLQTELGLEPTGVVDLATWLTATGSELGGGAPDSGATTTTAP